MIELIADILFSAFVIIILIISYKGFNVSLLYNDNKYGLIVISIILIYITSAIITFLAIIFAPYKLGLSISFSSYPKFETAIHLVISSTMALFLSSKVMKITIDYFKKEGMVVQKK